MINIIFWRQISAANYTLRLTQCPLQHPPLTIYNIINYNTIIIITYKPKNIKMR